MPKTKICKECLIKQPLENFHLSSTHSPSDPNSKTEPRRANKCKTCRATYFIEHDLKHPEKRLGYARSNQGRFVSGKCSAKSRGIPWELNFPQWFIIINNNDCHYCDGKLPETGSSLDRKDNNIGYLYDNVAPCCSACNELKGAWLTYEEMVMIMDRRKK